MLNGSREIALIRQVYFTGYPEMFACARSYSTYMYVNTASAAIVGFTMVIVSAEFGGKQRCELEPSIFDPVGA